MLNRKAKERQDAKKRKEAESGVDKDKDIKE